MPGWARVFVLLTGMLAWLAIVIVSLLLRQIPSAVVVGFPAALWIALAGSTSIARRRVSRNEPAVVEAATETEGDRA
jgi:membrane protein required for beta-lactamase induction